MKINLVSKFEKSTETLVVPVAGKNAQDTFAKLAVQTYTTAEQIDKDFKANLGETMVLYGKDQSRIILLGLGQSPQFNDVLKAFRSFSNKSNKRISSSFGVSFQMDNCAEENIAIWVDACANGLILGTYSTGKYKTQHIPSHTLAPDEIQVTIFAPPLDTITSAIQRGTHIGRTQTEILDLVNAPANKKSPADLAKWAVQSGKQYDFKVEVIDKEKAAQIGLHALLAVNRGSEAPATFIIMEYIPDGVENAPTVGLVGKGVTFDTGGISIKPSSNMHFMKSDMGGAAAVLGTMEAVAKLKLPVHLIGIVPSTDNSVDALAIKPSDVIDSYSGKTIEIIDTDAEGRLILADGLAYMIKHFQPEILIDLATLTGSAVRTFGYHAAALFSKDVDLSTAIQKAGAKSGERVWPLPLWDVYKEDLKSDVADIRNYSGRPLAGAIGAAKFLEFFTNDHPKWAHLDIAGVAFNDAEFTTMKSASAYGIRLLTTYLYSLSDN